MPHLYLTFYKRSLVWLLLQRVNFETYVRRTVLFARNVISFQLKLTAARLKKGYRAVI